MLLERNQPMNKLYVSFVIVFALISCSRINQDKKRSDRFIKICITDSNIRSAFNQYSKAYDFEGKGVIVANVAVNSDTVKCLMLLILEKEFFEQWLKQRKFVLFDTIGGRIVILSTSLEPYIDFANHEAFNDSIIDKYLIHEDGGIHEIWLMEYFISKGTVIKRVVRNKMIYLTAPNSVYT